MKKTMLTLAALSSCFVSYNSFAANAEQQLSDKKDKVSYSIGLDIGRSIQRQNVEINPDIFFAGIKDGLTNKTARMTDDEVRQTLLALQTEILEKQKQLLSEVAAKNLSAGQKFLDENKKRKDVVSLPNGLQYRVIKQGDGTAPKTSDMVTTHYRGKLIDGTEFDSSYSRGEPVKFAVDNVIPGWTEALQLMKPGAKWELFIPPQLAYGENGVGQVIGPNSTLIFEVELLKVENPEPNTTTEKPATKK